MVRFTQVSRLLKKRMKFNLIDEHVKNMLIFFSIFVSQSETELHLLIEVANNFK